MLSYNRMMMMMTSIAAHSTSNDHRLVVVVDHLLDRHDRVVDVIFGSTQIVAIRITVLRSVENNRIMNMIIVAVGCINTKDGRHSKIFACGSIAAMRDAKIKFGSIGNCWQPILI